MVWLRVTGAHHGVKGLTGPCRSVSGWERTRSGRSSTPQDPGRSLAALQAIEELSRQTAAEIDHFVGALRVGSASEETVEAPPGLASLDTLVAQHTATGLEVVLDTAGAPRPLTGGSDQAAFRILQEALTNAARHGTGAARVELTSGDEALEVAVTSRLPPGASPRATGGHGLVGMRERASLLGGALAAEQSGEAFCVRARLPYGGCRQVTRVLIADDDDLMRAGLAELLAADPSIEVVAHAATGTPGRRACPPADA